VSTVWLGAIPAGAADAIRGDPVPFSQESHWGTAKRTKLISKSTPTRLEQAAAAPGKRERLIRPEINTTPLQN